MDFLWWFLKLWTWRCWGFEWFKSSGFSSLLLVFILGFMLLQLKIIRLIWLGLTGKCGGGCSKSDFGDHFWYEKLCSCIKCCLGSILRPLVVIQQCRDFELNEVFYDCMAHEGDQPLNNLECPFVDLWSCEDEVEVDQLFWECEEGDVFDAEVLALREMLESERRRADAAVVELEKERLANASAAEEAMGMILRLQSEKSLMQTEARNYKKMAEQKMLYDHEIIQSLRFLLFKHQSELGLMEERLRLCRQKLKLFSQETEVNGNEELNVTFSDFTMDNFYKSENTLLQLYSSNWSTERHLISAAGSIS